MTNRLVVWLTVGVIAATALPFVLSATLVQNAGGSGVVNGTIWVANEGSDSVTAIDANTHAVVTIVRGIKAPHNVQASPNGDTIWVTSPPAGLVAVIDSHTLALKGTVPTGSGPSHVVLTPDGQTALVTNAEDDSLAIIDVSSLKVVQRVPTGSYPHGIRPSPDGRNALLANLGSSTLELVDVNGAGVIGRVDVGATPVQVAYAPGGLLAYATVNGTNEVVKIDVQRSKVVGRVRVSRGPVQLATTPDGSLLVVASQGTEKRPSRTASLIDTRTMRLSRVLATGSGAHGVTVEPGGRQAFVTDVWAGDVAVIDLDDPGVVDRIRVGGKPNGITYSPVRQPHARSAANMGSPREVRLPLGGSVDGTGSGGHHH